MATQRDISDSLQHQALLNLWNNLYDYAVLLEAALTSLRTGVNNMALGPAGLAIGTVSAAKVKIANTVNYLIGGVFKQKTTAEIDFTDITHDIPANAGAVQEAVYLYTIQANGTVTVTMGAIASGAGNAAIPAGPAGEAVLGYLRLAVAAGATPFNATTDLLSAAHLTDTYVDLPFAALTAIPALTDYFAK